MMTLGLERRRGTEGLTKRSQQITGLIVGRQGQVGGGLKDTSPLLVLKTKTGDTGEEEKMYFRAQTERRENRCSACTLVCDPIE